VEGTAGQGRFLRVGLRYSRRSEKINRAKKPGFETPEILDQAARAARPGSRLGWPARKRRPFHRQREHAGEEQVADQRVAEEEERRRKLGMSDGHRLPPTHKGLGIVGVAEEREVLVAK